MQQVFPEAPFDPPRAVPAFFADEPVGTAKPDHQLRDAAVRKSRQEEFRTRLQEGT